MTEVAHLYRVVQDQNTGKILSGVSVMLCEPGSTTPISDQLYADEDLTRTMSNPFTAQKGIIDVYLAEPRNVLVKTTYGSKTTKANNIPILPRPEFLLSTPVPVQITNGPGTDAVLIGIDAASAEFRLLDDIFVSTVNTLTGWALTQAFALIGITRDSNGAATEGEVTWPDGTFGIYTADTISPDFPGRVDAWHVTYGDPVQYIFTQSAVTRDANGNIISQPMIVVSDGP